MIKRITLSFLALLTAVAARAQNPAPCSELFLSEYVEGTGNNKAIEIYNPTTGTVDLSQYKVWISYNGGSSSQSTDLTGTLAPDGVFVLAHSLAHPDILAVADQVSAALDFNGNDAIALVNVITGDTIDVFGVIGEDPVDGFWTVSQDDPTLDQSIVRDASVNNGNLDWEEAQDEWFAIGNNVFFSLGNHFMQPCGAQTDPVVSFAATNQTVGEGWTDVDATVTINYPNATATEVTIGVAAGGTATPGADFVMPGVTTLTFPANSAVALALNVLIVEDMDLEPLEFFILQITAVTNNGTIVNQFDTIYIEDNDDQIEPPMLYLNPPSITVDEDGVVAVLQVEIGPPNNMPTSVEVIVNLGSTTASLNDDFTIQSPLIVTFPPMSSASIPFVINIVDDLLTEANEVITLSLVNPTNNAGVGPDAVITIVDNDPQSVANLERFGISARPNPASSFSNVTANAVVKRCDVFNAAGQLMFSTEPNAAHFKLDVNALAPGIYFLEAVTATGTLHFRLAKQ